MRVSICVLIVAVLCVGTFATQVDDDLSPSASFGEESGPYCGLYSAARLTSLLRGGEGIDLQKYVTSRYVVGAGGSTPNQISELLRENGVTVVGLQSLTSADLLSASVPWIANVRVYPDSPSYNHWVCIHSHGTQVTIYDGAGPPHYVSLGEFLAVWNGFALIPTQAYGVVSVYVCRSCLLVLATSLLAVAVLRIQRTRWRLAWRLTAIAGFVGVISFLLAADPAHHGLATRLASVPWTADRFSLISLNQLIVEAEQGNAQLIDARYKTDFVQGSLPGAINIPVNVSLTTVRRLTESLNPHTRTIVFCQSKSCTFDRQVAKRLTMLGFQVVQIADGGWSEYLDLMRTDRETERVSESVD